MCGHFSNHLAVISSNTFESVSLVCVYFLIFLFYVVMWEGGITVYDIKCNRSEICHHDSARWKSCNKQLLYFLFIMLSFGFMPF